MVALDKRAATAKLQHYADIYGSWVKDLTVEQARGLAANRQSLTLLKCSTSQYLYWLVETIHFGAIAECLAVLDEAETETEGA